MKIITYVVPCYNSSAYMDKCIGTLLQSGKEEDIEILLINDGSSDNTGKIADSYKEKYPNIVNVIHQENGGHGEGVNQGIRNANGLYMKVVDSDDWIDVESGKKIILKIKEMIGTGENVDMYICNYVYEHVADGKSKVMDYKNILPENKIFQWKDTKSFGYSRYLLMHSLIYKTEVLRKSGLELPKHTFYVDNMFAYIPFPYVETMYYMNLDLYRYFIGREDQSVNEAVMVKRVDQQLRVTYLMAKSHNLELIKKKDKKLSVYMKKYLSMMVVISIVLLLLDGSDEALKKREDLWDYIRSIDENLYSSIRHRSLAIFMSFPGSGGRKLSIYCYKVAQKLYKFN
ncbi:MAG: glycosyltransferase family 2 protein [Clostridium sp.]|nr:glycosyltransferase family 2 protein [Clostridium sp.]